MKRVDPKRGERGLTLIELIVAFTILSLLTTMAVPLARYRVRIEQERELRYALRTITKAIDDYKDAATRQKIEVKLGTNGYPETLEQLVNGVKLLQTADGKKIKFLRRIPKDPMTNSYDWGLRSDAGRSGLEELGRAERFRRIHQEHGEGTRWNALFGVVKNRRTAGGVCASTAIR